MYKIELNPLIVSREVLYEIILKLMVFSNHN